MALVRRNNEQQATKRRWSTWYRPDTDAAFGVQHSLPRDVATVKRRALLAAIGRWRRQVFETHSDMSSTSPVSRCAAYVVVSDRTLVVPLIAQVLSAACRRDVASNAHAFRGVEQCVRSL
jgi:hypothetical protein